MAVIRSDRYVRDRKLKQDRDLVVEVARDVDSGRRVVIRQLPPELPVQCEAGESLRRMKEVLDGLERHPHVETVVDSGTDELGRPVLVTSYFEGTPLSVRLEQGPLPATRWLALAVELLTILDHLAGQGILHGDLHPGHVIVKDDVLMGIVDLGGAQQLDLPRTVRGSDPTTMAPEVLSGDNYGARTELYSTGMVLLQAAVGHERWRTIAGGSSRGQSRDQWFGLHTRGFPVPDLRTIAGVGWDAISAEPTLRQLVAREPTDRPEGAREALDLLSRDLNTAIAPFLPAEGSIDAGWTAIQRSTGRKRKDARNSRRHVWLAGAACSLLGLGLLAVGAQSRGRAAGCRLDSRLEAMAQEAVGDSRRAQRISVQLEAVGCSDLARTLRQTTSSETEAGHADTHFRAP